MKLQLSYPLDMVIINQKFGNVDPVYTEMGLKGHNGIDFRASHGIPVYATHDGTAYYEFDSGQGEGVVIRTDQPFDDEQGGECYYKTISWHLCDSLLEPQFASPVYKAVGYKPDQTGVSQIGIPVKNGDLIGYADNTGLSTGDHLHFGLKPQAKNESNGTWINTAQTNGYNGAIDPMPYFDGTYPQQIHNMETQVSLLKKVVDFLKQLIGMTRP
jgi:murein DD-endopeptidase MepM/ murein hydrolase activator NlpD